MLSPLCKKCGNRFVSPVKQYGLCDRCYNEERDAVYLARTDMKPKYGFHDGLFAPDKFGIVKKGYNISREG